MSGQRDVADLDTDNLYFFTACSQDRELYIFNDKKLLPSYGVVV